MKGCNGNPKPTKSRPRTGPKNGTGPRGTGTAKRGTGKKKEIQMKILPVAMALFLSVMVASLLSTSAHATQPNGCSSPGQVPVENQQFSGGGTCEWVVEPSFFVPSGQTLHCRTIFVFGEPEIYNIDLHWNGKTFDVERLWESDLSE